ncbi:putative START-like domain-containing protein [Lupinus albus]|uniref:Putative START-like domain-containing protein n=1 Tax=Lupinus albus TaxID=3870 RepID=A0A6A4PQX0_LUPAL|nr:putative START-like domain-containing protein [Lupinus albus]
MAFPSPLLVMLENPTVFGVFSGMVLFLGPIWLAFFIGLSVGWLWKPKWASMGKEKLTSSLAKSFDFCSPYSFSPSNVDKKASSSSPPVKFGSSSSKSNSNSGISNVCTTEDFHHLFQLVEETDGGLPWIQMMDRSTLNMYYQAWRREPKDGPPQYRSSSIFEDATPEILRDLFWDDEFRPRWDDMLIRSTILEDCPTTGNMKVHWIRKFPFFCKDREYIIGRRIWQSGGAYYCVTKGIDCPSVPRVDKPRRVDVYYSSWCIRAVESKRNKGQMTACEVLLFHHEDMGIPWEIAKLGVRKGMWGTVLKIEPGLRAYQEARAAGAQLSRPAIMAQVNTKINPKYLQSIGTTENSRETESVITGEKPQRVNVSKILVIGGAIALACSLDKGLVTKYVIFGVARRFTNIGKAQLQNQ